MFIDVEEQSDDFGNSRLTAQQRETYQEHLSTFFLKLKKRSWCLAHHPWWQGGKLSEALLL